MNIRAGDEVLADGRRRRLSMKPPRHAQWPSISTAPGGGSGAQTSDHDGADIDSPEQVDA